MTGEPLPTVPESAPRTTWNCANGFHTEQCRWGLCECACHDAPRPVPETAARCQSCEHPAHSDWGCYELKESGTRCFCYHEPPAPPAEPVEEAQRVTQVAELQRQLAHLGGVNRANMDAAEANEEAFDAEHVKFMRETLRTSALMRLVAELAGELRANHWAYTRHSGPTFEPHCSACLLTAKAERLKTDVTDEVLGIAP